MSRRRTVLQLDEPRESSPYTGSRRRGPPSEDDQSQDDDDDDPMGDMPTPERLVPPDMPLPMPNGGEKLDIDNKVANFLAEIDALDHGDENSQSPGPSHEPQNDDTPPHYQLQHSPPPGAATPPRSPTRSKSGPYSMFVRGDTEFKRHERERQRAKSGSNAEKWPEEPKSEWQQLTDEKSNYPYYWNTETNQVVWDMPSEFQQYLLLHKEYEEKVEKGLKEGKLKPEDRPGARPEQRPEQREGPQERPTESSEKSHSRRERKHSSSSDSSQDSSSDSDRSSSKGSRKGSVSKTTERPSSTSHNEARDTNREGDIKASTSNQDSQDLPDSTESEEKNNQNAKANSEEMDFDIDDIDKELEMALERKRQELMKLEDTGKSNDDKDKKPKEADREKNKENHKRKEEKRDEEGRRKHDRKKDEHREHRDERRHREHKDKERKRSKEDKEDKKPKLSLKDRLRMEMEMKLEKERRKKKAIEDLMARELEMTVGAKNRKRHHRDSYEREEQRKRYKDDEEDIDNYRRDYRDAYDDRGMDDYSRYDVTYDRYKGYDDRMDPPPRTMTPPPPTAEMVAYEKERKSKVVDYGHGRSRGYDHNGESDNEESRGGFEERDLEMKKLEALQLAELALSKLEFLEVTKKGLSKLQILLIELETRHQDWQAGGLSTNHFLMKLREANWQLEQYEESAAPEGWVCSWDRDYRRYFYTHKLTSKTQWDYPDADEISIEEARAAEGIREARIKERDGEISSTTRFGDRTRRAPDSSLSRSKKAATSQKDIIKKAATLPPPPPPPAEEHPLVKSLQLMYGSTSGSDSGEESPNRHKRRRSKEDKKVEPEIVVPAPSSIPLPPAPPDNKGDRGEEKKERGKEEKSDRAKEEKRDRKEKKEKHKSKKKKKEKSKKKEKERRVEAPAVAGPIGPVGPIMPPAPVMPVAPEGLITTSEQMVPVYGPQSGLELYGQNDEPLQFGGVIADGNQMVEPMDASYMGQPILAQGEMEQPILQPPQLTEGAEIVHAPETYHPPETYATSSGFPGAGDQTEMGTEGAEGSYQTEGVPVVDSGTTATPGGEDRKKKKKEKMGTSNISLKKKHVSSMVQKWQKVKKEVEEEERNRDEREAEIRRKLQELQEELG